MLLLLKWVSTQTIGSVSGMVQPIMRELLQQIDLDYYRSVRLLIAHAELEQLREGCPASSHVGRWGSPRTDNESVDVNIATRRAACAAE
jgi:hypothetical protein